MMQAKRFEPVIMALVPRTERPCAEFADLLFMESILKRGLW